MCVHEREREREKEREKEYVKHAFDKQSDISKAVVGPKRSTSLDSARPQFISQNAFLWSSLSKFVSTVAINIGVQSIDH